MEEYVNLEITSDGEGHIASAARRLPSYIDFIIVENPIAKKELQEAIAAFDWLIKMMENF